jgi:hypothetical protein
MKARPWGFTLEIETGYSRSTTQNAIQVVLPPPLAKAVAASRQTPDRHGEMVSHCPHHNQNPPLPTSDRSHEFLNLCQLHENLYVDVSHVTDKKQSFAPHPHETSQAEDKGMRDWIDSILEI